MKILVGIGHPKQVHFWRNIINNLVNKGHSIKIVAWDKDITYYLLDTYGFEYEKIGKNCKGLFKKACGLLTSEIKLMSIVTKFKPDILVGGAPYLAHVSKFYGKPHISFTDTEHASIANLLSSPFSDVICTPSCFKEKIDPKKHIKFNGYMELAYLHPNQFEPDPTVLIDMGINNSDKYIIMRLVSLNSSHDMNTKGFSIDFLEQSIKEIEKYGRVYISSETKLSKKLEKYKIVFSPEKFHSALYYSSVYIGDGGTAAVEAAILGTPSIHLISVKSRSGKIIGASEIHGNFDDLANKYGMLYSYTNEKQAINKALELLKNNSAKSELNIKRRKLFKEKVDVTAFFTNFVSRYPTSYYEFK